MEIRYWAFMESHPVHVVLPPGAQKDAIDVLTWALTEPVLPQHKMSCVLPFTQSECQRLLQLLRPFGGGEYLQSTSITRVVSRILLRVGEFFLRADFHSTLTRIYLAQHHRALSSDIGNEQLHSPGFIRRAVDVLMSVLLLGVPYLVHTRAVYHMTDAERAIIERTSLPTLLIGMCTCLLAAVLLGASVTFLSLPGLQSIPHATALAVVLLAAGAIIVSVLALFRYEAELVDTVPVNVEFVGRKGSLIISTRSVIMSLPLALFMYAVLAFVATFLLHWANVKS
ncbi:hypothetical protein C8R45DRAFT_846045 [Mycena sanguinolenta]|nr:hypothetical protein C8R45DRAFT_846045 [Mycena sanguinolenta]